MARSGTKKRDYAVNRHKRHRIKRPTKHKREDRFRFREEMIRSLDDLELGGFIPAYSELKELFDDPQKMIDYCISKETFRVPKSCPRCEKPVKLGARHTVRCRRPSCAYTMPMICQRCESDNMTPSWESNGQIKCTDCSDCKWQWRPGVEFERSIFRNSFAQQCNIPKNVLMHLLWLWLHKVPTGTAAVMLMLNEETTSQWYKTFRRMVAEMIDNDEAGESLMLGGYDEDGNPIVVEADESKFARRKYNRGRRVKGSWVIGMVERTKQRRCAMVVVETRDAKVCCEIIKKYIRPGSIIHTDMWGGYNPINKLGLDYQHRTLNHSKEFVSVKEDGTVVHTQTIEGNWGTMKKSIPIHKRNGADLQDCLFEFMWRRANAGNLWLALLRGLAKVRFAVPELLRVDEIDTPWEKTDVLVNIEDCVDYDSANTEETESDSDNEVNNGNAASRHPTRQPVADAVTSADWWRERREEQRQQEEQDAVDRKLKGGVETKEGSSGVI